MHEKLARRLTQRAAELRDGEEKPGSDDIAPYPGMSQP